MRKIFVRVSFFTVLVLSVTFFLNSGSVAALSTSGTGQAVEVKKCITKPLLDSIGIYSEIPKPYDGFDDVINLDPYADQEITVCERVLVCQTHPVKELDSEYPWCFRTVELWKGQFTDGYGKTVTGWTESIFLYGETFSDLPVDDLRDKPVKSNPLNR